MNDHLKIQVKGHFLPLPDDFSIDYEESNPIFNETPDAFSYPINVKFDGARAWLQNIDFYQSDLRPIDLEHDAGRIWVEGMPFRSGETVISEDAVLENEFSFSIDAKTKSLNDYISDLNCQDVPVDDNILIGKKIGNVCVDYSVSYHYEVKSGGKTGFLSWSSTEIKSHSYDPENIAEVSCEPQALGFSVPLNVNISEPYPTAKYCNARVCYTHYKLGEDGKTSSDVDINTTNDKGEVVSQYAPYYVLEAYRPQTGVCFYVMYFLDKLFQYLNVKYDNANLTAVGDMNRLCFFTTHCEYDVKRTNNTSGFDYQSEDAINNALQSWAATANQAEINGQANATDTIKCGKLTVKIEEKKSLESVRYINGQTYNIGDKLPGGETLKAADYIVDGFTGTMKANSLNMYANSKNFPNQSVSSVIESFWGSFGVRFVLDYETRTVTPYFVRDVLKDSRTPINITGTILSINKMAEKKKGVRMKYSDESDYKDQQQYISNGTKDYNTDYDYTDYRNINTNLTYKSIVKKDGISDTTCYVDLTTGNRYRIKVNSEATTHNNMNAALFQVGTLKGVEWGDCSPENEDFVEVIESSFQPVIFSDVNGRKEKTAYTTDENVTGQNGMESGTISGENVKDAQQILAAYIDEDMFNENESFQIKNAMGTDHVNFYVVEEINTLEAYDPSKTDDGNSPLQSYDWGMAIAIMRGGGSNATVQKYDYDYDGCGSYHWRMTAGTSAISIDSIDTWGNEYDYNGNIDGIDYSNPADVKANERFSLKIRAYIEDKNGQILCANDVYTYINTVSGETVTASTYAAMTDAQKANVKRVATKKIRSRGLADTFMSEYAYFLLNRQKYEIKMLCSAAQLCNIPNNWDRRFRIGDVTGWIDRVRTSVSCKNGVELVTITMYSL